MTITGIEYTRHSASVLKPNVAQPVVSLSKRNKQPCVKTLWHSKRGRDNAYKYSNTTSYVDLFELVFLVWLTCRILRRKFCNYLSRWFHLRYKNTQWVKWEPLIGRYVTSNIAPSWANALLYRVFDQTLILITFSSKNSTELICYIGKPPYSYNQESSGQVKEDSTNVCI